MEWWQQLGPAIGPFLEQYGPLGLFLLLLIEEAGAPLPVPGDLVMVLSGAQVAQGRLSLIEALLVMELATVLGASCLYWLSARAGQRVIGRLGRYVGLTPARLERASRELERHGPTAVVLGRLTPGLRIATPVVCGLLRFPFRLFLPAMALGAFLYILAYTLLGLFGPRLLASLQDLELPPSLAAPAVLTALALGWLWWSRRRPEPSAR